MTVKLASILVITRNDKDSIERNLRSILSQSHKDIEIVIVDSSDDDSSSIIERCIKNYNTENFKVNYLHTEAKGAGAARNTALELSSGEYIFFVDADCYIPKDFVRRAVEIFSQDERILSINISVIEHSNDKGAFAQAIRLFELARQPSPYHVGSGSLPECDRFQFWVCRKKVFEKVGLFDNDLEAGEDTEWILKSRKLYPRLREEGYKSVPARLVIYEEKKGRSFRRYWRKSMWYGKAFADLDYIKATSVRSIFDLVLMLTQVTYPVSIAILPLGLHLNYLFIAHTLGFVAPSLYIVCRLGSKGKQLSIALMPLLIFYKSLFELSGAFYKVFKNIGKSIANHVIPNAVIPSLE